MPGRSHETLPEMTDLLEEWRDPVFNGRHAQVPVDLATRLTDMVDEIFGRHIYYERMHALLVVAPAGATWDLLGAPADQPPSADERELGRAIGQAFHQGCQLRDVALAAQLPPERVVAIGRRTIRGTRWLQRL